MLQQCLTNYYFWVNCAFKGIARHIEIFIFFFLCRGLDEKIDRLRMSCLCGKCKDPASS